MNDAEIRSRVLRLVRQFVPESPHSSDEFILVGEGGGFDSVLALELLLALEAEFGIVMKDDDVQPKNLASVDSIVTFVKDALSRRA
jgi:acyl carrier protein